MAKSREFERELATRTPVAVGLDASHSTLRNHRTLRHLVVGSAELMPFRDGCFTLITANMVMEHIVDPSAVLTEVHRVLQTNGLFVFHTTNLANYNIRLAALLPQWLKTKIISILEARRESDVFPTACAFNTSPHRGDSTAFGFKVSPIQMLNSTAATAALPPLAIVELLVTRMLRRPAARRFRSNTIGILQNV